MAVVVRAPARELTGELQPAAATTNTAAAAAVRHLVAEWEEVRT